MKRSAPLKRSPLKSSRKPITRRGGRRFPGRADLGYLRWLRNEFPCAVCAASGQVQTDQTEVEHWVTKARGGFDRGDTFPTCKRHRIERHTLGDQTFQARYPQREWSTAGRLYSIMHAEGAA